MLPVHHWARSFSIESEDIEQLTHRLLEEEIPLSSTELVQALLEQRIQSEADALAEHYKDAQVYNPAGSFAVGQKLVFPALDYATAVIHGMREGQNEEYGIFEVIAVDFGGDTREFATKLTIPHVLSQNAEDGNGLILAADQISVEDILAEVGDAIIEKVEAHLKDNSDLVMVAKKWFPRDLMLDADEGHLNLAEAVLDISESRPMQTQDILEQIGGLGKSSRDLQVFSFNYALNQDSRFDEVGPTGAVLWCLVRQEPVEVQKTPLQLGYRAIDYDRSLLNAEALTLEAEIADELSPLEFDIMVDSATVSLIYPHRRIGTFPLNNITRSIFPSAERTSRIWITLIDESDGEEFNGWVVPENHYVFGMDKIYRKHSLPIGGYVTVKRGDNPGRVYVSINTYRPRSEWIRLLAVVNDQLHFENSKRAIGVDYDDLMILGVENLEVIDQMALSIQKQQSSLASTLRTVIPSLGGLTPQGTVHTRTIYSVVNVIRRCPPGPIMALLEANPDFENVGGHYWKLA